VKLCSSFHRSAGPSVYAAGEPPRSLRQFIASVRAGCPSHARPAHHRFSSGTAVCSHVIPRQRRHCGALPGKWARRFYVSGSSMKRSPNLIRSLAKARLASRAGQDAFAPTQKSRFASAAHFVRMPMSVPRPQRPNPSVEGTHNGGARLLASATSAAPSCAPHVKR
jgi:hypothetical protein